MSGALALRVMVPSESRPWEASPSRTVWRKRLHRVGAAEAGQVTSLVRFEPGATFGDHGHPQGEEILVLEGTFSDETGSWGRGWYLVSPAGTNHAPFSAGGCTLFVKLQQFAGPGRPAIKLDTSDMPWRSKGNGDVEEKILFRQEPFVDSTRLERWRAGARVERPCPGGLEIFVLDGDIGESEEELDVGAWLRLPPGGVLRAHSLRGCALYVKDGGVAGLRGEGT